MEGLERKDRRTAPGCLLIHGFGGNVKEVKPLADLLMERGYKVETPSLQGHTGKREDLRKCSYRDWISSAQKGYDKLRAECDIVFLIGFSMGGLIAFRIAASHRADAVVTLNTPIYYWDLKRVALNILEDVRSGKLDNLRRYIHSSKNLPLPALLNFSRLLSGTKPLLKEVVCPVFAAQALEDDTVRRNSADYIYAHVAAPCRKLEFYERSGHQILWSRAAEKVMKDVSDFLDRAEKGL